MKKVFIQTYGCQMNEYDTELIRSILTEHDYALTDNADEAEVVMLNTCAIRENAHNKVFNQVHLYRQRLKQEPYIGILGCMATNLREKLLESKSPNIDFIAGPDSYRRLPELIKAVRKNRQKAYDLSLSDYETYEGIYPSRKKGVNAWLAVMRGCDNFCSFCVVPYTRGRERSRSVQSIVEEVKHLAGEGYRQVTLLGQNVNSYKHGEDDFAKLLESVSAVEGIERIRFTSPHPKDFPHNLIESVAHNPKVCKHIHLPLQSGSNRILDKMNRTYTKEEFAGLVEHIRKANEDITLTTDIIIGFPTETDEEFNETALLVRQIGFDAAYIFKYSEREGTIAKRKYPDDVSESKKTERITQLNDIQRGISLDKNKSRIGKTYRILIEEDGTKRSKDDVQGRTDGNILVIVPKGPYRSGDFMEVDIIGATPNVLKGVYSVKSKDQGSLCTSRYGEGYR